LILILVSICEIEMGSEVGYVTTMKYVPMDLLLVVLQAAKEEQAISRWKRS